MFGQSSLYKLIKKIFQKKAYRSFPELISELDARDAVFRMDFKSKEHLSKLPWSISFGKGKIQMEGDALWQQLFEGRISEETALDSMTDLMERYYGRTYPLKEKRHANSKSHRRGRRG